MGRDGKNGLKDFGEINGLIDRGCEFEGNLNFEGVVQINGGFTGEINSDGRLVVGRDANLKAKVTVGDLIVEGRIEGDIEAKGKVEIRSCAVVLANVVTNSLVIEAGGVFNGQCKMEGAETYVASNTKDKPAPFFVEHDETQVQ